jgi:hypothetical protein
MVPDICMFLSCHHNAGQIQNIKIYKHNQQIIKKCGKGKIFGDERDGKL